MFDRNIMTLEDNGRKIKFTETAFSNIAASMFTFFLSTLQTATVSGYSDTATTIVGVVGTIFNLAMTLGLIITQGVRIMLNISLGAGRRRDANVYAGTGFYMCMIIGIIAGIVLYYFASEFLVFMNMKRDLMPIAIPHLKIRALFIPIGVIFLYLINVLICEGYAFRVLIVNVINGIASILFCKCVLYADIVKYVDRVVAISLAIGLAYLISALIAVFFILKYKCVFSLKFRLRYVKDILRMGIPSGMNSLSYNITQMVGTSFTSILGITALNTKIYASSVVTFAYAFSYAIANATGIFIGRYRGIGAFDKIKKMHRYNSRIAVLCNSSVSILLFVLHIPIIGIFTKNAEIIKLAGIIMFMDIIVEAIRGKNHVNEFALSSNGDVKVMFITTVISSWFFGVFCGYILGIKLGLGLPGIWMGYVLEEGIKNAVYSLRWKSEKWMNISMVN